MNGKVTCNIAPFCFMNNSSNCSSLISLFSNMHLNFKSFHTVKLDIKQNSFGTSNSNATSLLHFIVSRFIKSFRTFFVNSNFFGITQHHIGITLLEESIPKLLFILVMYLLYKFSYSLRILFSLHTYIGFLLSLSNTFILSRTNLS